MDSPSDPADQARLRDTREDPAYLSTGANRPRQSRPRASSSAATGESGAFTDNPDDGFRSDTDGRPRPASRSASLREPRGGPPGYVIHPSMGGYGPLGSYGGMGYPADPYLPYDGRYPTQYSTPSFYPQDGFPSMHSFELYSGSTNPRYPPAYTPRLSPRLSPETAFDFARPPLVGSPRRGPSSRSSDETRSDQSPRPRKSTRQRKARDHGPISTSGPERSSVDTGKSKIHRHREIPSIRLDTTATNQQTYKIQGETKTLIIDDIQFTWNEQGDGLTVRSLDGLPIKEVIRHDHWDSEFGSAATIVFAKHRPPRDEDPTQEEEDSPVRVTLSEAYVSTSPTAPDRSERTGVWLPGSDTLEETEGIFTRTGTGFSPRRSRRSSPGHEPFPDPMYARRESMVTHPGGDDFQPSEATTTTLPERPKARSSR
ncbi:hypothetical protein V865_003941 [Kwoniella europaea PYCC6329]|uniref:Uncharacterized protein n=1 Tax=Kwoniella europaea PYCC6329 TaxID=1423913 RepID=A0AAX4KJD4_9TREE